jgi:hypothetical protein
MSTELASTVSAAVRHEIKRERAALGRMPRAAATTRCAELVRNPPPELAAMRVGPLLSSLPGVGDSVRRRIIRHAGVAADDRLRDLTPRKRDLLAHAILLPSAEQKRLIAAPALPSVTVAHSRVVRVLERARRPDGTYDHRAVDIALNELRDLSGRTAA